MFIVRGDGMSNKDELNYYILSLKWSPCRDTGMAVWWGSDCSGYISDLKQAGRYNREEIEARPHYFNDGVETLAVREDLALEMSHDVVLVRYPGASWWRDHVKIRSVDG
jgi:hypothetical protein